MTARPLAFAPKAKRLHPDSFGSGGVWFFVPSTMRGEEGGDGRVRVIFASVGRIS